MLLRFGTIGWTKIISDSSNYKTNDRRTGRGYTSRGLKIDVFSASSSYAQVTRLTISRIHSAAIDM